MNGTSRKTATGTRRKMSAAVRVSCFRSRLGRRVSQTQIWTAAESPGTGVLRAGQKLSAVPNLHKRTWV